MKRTLSAALAATIATLSATPVLAHAGEHGHDGFWHTVEHFLTNPDHLLPLAAAVVVIALCVKRPAALMRAVRAITRRSAK